MTYRQGYTGLGVADSVTTKAWALALPIYFATSLALLLATSYLPLATCYLGLELVLGLRFLILLLASVYLLFATN